MLLFMLQKSDLHRMRVVSLHWWTVFLSVQLHRNRFTVLEDFNCAVLFKLHVYGKQHISDSRCEFLKIENEQLKTAQNNSYG